MRLALAGLLLLAACREEPSPAPAPAPAPAAAMPGTQQQQLEVRIAYSTALGALDCALVLGPDESAATRLQLARLEEVRRSARARGLGPLVAHSLRQWREGMATADYACPPRPYAESLGRAIDDLERALLLSRPRTAAERRHPPIEQP